MTDSRQISLLGDSPAPAKVASPLAQFRIESRPASAVSDDDVVGAVAMYNQIASEYNWTKCRKLTTTQINQIRARLRELHDIDGQTYTGTPLAGKVYELVESSAFLRDQKTPKIAISWIFGPRNFKEIIDGKYTARAAPSHADQRAYSPFHAYADKR